VVQVGRVVTGAVFLTLFAGFELHIPAIENLIPGSYGGLAYTGYVGFGFLITGITSLASGLSAPSRRSFGSVMPGAAGSSATPDQASMMAAMAAMARGPSTASPGYGGGSVLCASCGKFNLVGAKFCQHCAAPLPAAPSATPAPGPSDARTS